MIEYAAETKEGRVPEEDTLRLAIIMGESGFEELEQAVAPMPAGEEKNIKLKFPENFREPALAGKKARVDVKVVALNVTKLRSDNIDPRDYLNRLDDWEQRVYEGGGMWKVVNDLDRLDKLLDS